jgi:hypothetical protein
MNRRVTFPLREQRNKNVKIRRKVRFGYRYYIAIRFTLDNFIKPFARFLLNYYTLLYSDVFEYQ